MASSAFRKGMKAAIPVWIAFIPYSLAMGIAASANGLSLEEIVLMSAVVYAGPAQFAAIIPLGLGKPALQILLTTLILNLRFVVMAIGLVPYFRGVRRASLLLSSHLISASSFTLAYVHFRNKPPESGEEGDYGNLRYFLGIAFVPFCVWILGSGVGHSAALRIPAEFQEGLGFILPGYFAALLTTELQGHPIILVCLLSFVLAVPAAVVSPNWGWLTTALMITTLCWGMEQWMNRE